MNNNTTKPAGIELCEYDIANIANDRPHSIIHLPHANPGRWSRQRLLMVTQDDSGKIEVLYLEAVPQRISYDSCEYYEIDEAQLREMTDAGDLTEDDYLYNVDDVNREFEAIAEISAMAIAENNRASVVQVGMNIVCHKPYRKKDPVISAHVDKIEFMDTGMKIAHITTSDGYKTIVEVNESGKIRTSEWFQLKNHPNVANSREYYHFETNDHEKENN